MMSVQPDSLIKRSRGTVLPRWAGLGVLHVIVFVVSVGVLKHIDISGADLDHKGLVTALYTICRAILTLYVLAASAVLGTLVLRVSAGKKLSHDDEASIPHFIASFFLGSSLFGLLGTALGISGWLILPVALLAILPFVFLSPFCLRSKTLALLKADYWPSPASNGISAVFCRVLTCLLLLAAFVGFVWKGLYPASAEADVWELYLHYFREVLQTGSVGPGEAWLHYFASKGAGLVHIVGLLSDEFGVQLVSWTYCVVATLVVLDNLRSAFRDPAWALFGAVIFLSGVIADPTIGAFFRPHAVTAALIAFSIWAAVRILSPKADGSDAIIRSAVAVALYFGLYLTPVAPLFVTFFGALFITALCFRRFRHALFPFAALLVATFTGVFAELTISYAATGIASLVSVKLFWPIADQARFAATVGNSGLLYFIFFNNGTTEVFDLMPWLDRILRFQQFAPLLIGATILLVLFTARLIYLVSRGSLSFRRDRAQSVSIGLSVTILFLLIAIVPILTIQNESLLRLYFFLNFVVPVVVILTLIGLSEMWRPALLHGKALGVVLTLWAAIAMWQSLGSQSNAIFASLSYAAGGLTTADAMKRTADVAGEPDRFDFVREARQKIGPGPKIFALNYAPGPAYAFPRAGLMSEPTYTLGPQYLDMIFGEPDEAMRALHARKIDYFHVSLSAPLFSGLAFSKLFAADTIASHFKVVLRRGNQALLTWREPGEPPVWDADFFATLELKQKATLGFAFRQEFYWRLDDLTRTAPPCGNERCEAVQSLIESVADAVRDGIAPERLLPENRVLAQNIVDETRIALDRQLASGMGASALQSTDGRKQLTPTIAEIVQNVFANSCAERLGRPFCLPLTHQDERIPYGVIYRSRSHVEHMLRFDEQGGQTR